ncbi:MAG: hypothetical protein WAL75_11010 [Terracidiphilus sp.]
MTEETQQAAQGAMPDPEAMLKRAFRNILIFGMAASLVLWKASGWRDAAMLAAGTAVSASSTHEWRRLVRFINAKLDNHEAPRGTAIAILFFAFRLIVFGVVIYVSLKYIQGSAIALLCGLGLALLAMVWEGIRLIRG